MNQLFLLIKKKEGYWNQKYHRFCEIKMGDRYWEVKHPFCRYNCMQKYKTNYCGTKMTQFEDEFNIKQNSLRNLFVRSSAVSREKLLRGGVAVRDGTHLKPATYMYDWVRKTEYLSDQELFIWLFTLIYTKF